MAHWVALQLLTDNKCDASTQSRIQDRIGANSQPNKRSHVKQMNWPAKRARCTGSAHRNIKLDERSLVVNWATRMHATAGSSLPIRGDRSGRRCEDEHDHNAADYTRSVMARAPLADFGSMGKHTTTTTIGRGRPQANNRANERRSPTGQICRYAPTTQDTQSKECIVSSRRDDRLVRAGCLGCPLLALVRRMQELSIRRCV